MSTLGITHAVDNRNLAAYLNELSRKVRLLTEKICCLIGTMDNGGTPVTAVTSAGTGSIPTGFSSVGITKTSNNGGPVTITMSDSTTYTLDLQYETFMDASSQGSVLPAYTISGSGETWKWHGIK